MSESKVGTNIIKLIVKVRLSMQEEFASGKIKRTELWDIVLSKIKKESPNLHLTREQVNRKFLNLLTTYRRIKTRYRETGKPETSWEFFDDFEQIYGPNYYTIKPRKHNMFPADESKMYERQDEHCSDSQEECFSNSEPLAEKIRYKEILEHLEEESERDQKRHDEILAIEKKKLKLEEKAIEAMRDLKNVLERQYKINETKIRN